MDREKTGANIILSVLVILCLLLTYASLPMSDSQKNRNKQSLKARSLALLKEQAQLEMEEGRKAEEKNTAAEEKTVAQTSEKAPEPALPEPSDRVFADVEIIKMENLIYTSRKKGIVTFTHKKHVQTYELSCGECHHDSHGKALELTQDDHVYGCAVCHKATQKAKGEKLDKAQKIKKYHFEAMHANCVGCHKAHNIENGDPKGREPAPTSCTKCHPKE